MAEGIIAGNFAVYLGAAGATADLVGPPDSSTWTHLGNTKEGEGIKKSMSRTQHKVEAEGLLRPLAVLTSGIEEVLEATLIDCTPENIALTLRGDASTAAITTITATGTLEGAKEVSLDFPAHLPDMAVMFYGLGGPFYDSAGQPFALRFYYPLVALWGDWSISVMHGGNSEIPARFLALHHATLSPMLHFQTGPTT